MSLYSVQLPLVIKASAIEADDMRPAVLAGEVNLREMLYFCSQYRRMAIGSLFITGMPDDFFADLYNSGRAFLFFLQSRGDEQKATGRSEPFFDAVACHDVEGARAIAQQARSSWHPGEEYEEDFLYVYLLMQRFFLGADAGTLQVMLDRFEEVLEGFPDVRLDLCRALLAQDAVAFDTALEAFLTQKLDEVTEQVASESITPDDAATTAKLSVEALALVRLAEEAGLRLQDHYQLVPSLARMAHRARFPSPDAWKYLA